MSVPGGLCAMVFGGGSGQLDLPLSFGNVLDLAEANLNSSAGIRFNVDGTVTGIGSDLTTMDKLRWHVGTPSTGSFIRRVLDIGALTVDPGSGWLALSSAQTFSVGVTSNFADTNYCNLHFEFSFDGSTVAGTSSVTQLYAEVYVTG